MTAAELMGIERVCTFMCEIYIKGWYLSPLFTSAPKNVLDFIKNLIDFKKTDDEIASKALEKIKNHLGYLSKELICLSFLIMISP